MGYPHNGYYTSNEMEWTIVIHNINESSKQKLEEKKPETKECIINDSLKVQEQVKLIYGHRIVITLVRTGGDWSGHEGGSGCSVV